MKTHPPYRIGAVAALLLVLELALWAALLGAYFTYRKFDPSVSLHAPQYLPLAYGTALLTVVFLISLWWKNRAIKRLADAKLLESVAPRRSTPSTVLRFVLWRTAVLLMVIGLIDPKVGSRIEEVEARGIDLMIALDVSNSMLAEDLKPNRMEHSKRVVQRLIKSLQGNRLGIVIFAGDAYVQLPLTSDVQSAKIFLDAINTGIVPTQGTSIGSAIDLCIESFDPESEAGRMIVIITDGEDHEDAALVAARRAAETGIIITAIGAGRPETSPIPIYNSRGQRTGFRTDRNGKTVMTALNEQLLVELVQEGGGVFIRSNPSSVNLGPIMDVMNSLNKGETGSASFTDYKHLFHYFVVAAFALIVLSSLISERKWTFRLNVA